MTYSRVFKIPVGKIMSNEEVDEYVKRIIDGFNKPFPNKEYEIKKLREKRIEKLNNLNKINK